MLGALSLALVTAIGLNPAHAAPYYRLPGPGSYQLPPIKAAGDGAVLAEQGHSLRLHSLLGDKLVLLSFIYATCGDAKGCPLASQVLHKVGKRLAAEKGLADGLRLITLSFDPQRDTPEAMARYAESFREGLDWRFLTSAGDAALRPILDGYGQAAERVYDQQGRDTGAFAHVLRVYLIDRRRWIRNIYSVSTLHADVVVNDIRTLLMEGAGGQIPPSPPLSRGEPKKPFADKGRQAVADLLRWAERPPLGLPSLPVSRDDPVTADKIALGRKLFYDRRLSFNNSVSCAMCHVPCAMCHVPCAMCHVPRAGTGLHQQ